MLCCGMFPLQTLTWLSFNYKWMLNCFKCFVCTYWDDHIIFILHFINVVYHTKWSTDVELSLMPGINPTWLWYMIQFMYCWILFANILLRISASMFIIAELREENLAEGYSSINQTELKIVCVCLWREVKTRYTFWIFYNSTWETIGYLHSHL